MEPLVLIFNPLKSKLEKEVVDILKKYISINYFCLNDLYSSKQNLLVKPGLIFILLDNCCNNLENYDLENLYSHFSPVPVIGILKSNEVCSDCIYFKKYIWSFLTYPFKEADLLWLIEWYCHAKSSNTELVYNSLKKNTIFDLFIGESKKSLEIKEKILKIAQYDVTVLINGETGTGKELCARMIHFLSERSNNSFIPVNCGAIPSELFENELFGHKKGAYTNAESNENGLIAEANNGTLFLDEIESLREPMQVKLLRYLEEKKYKPLGQSNYVSSNVRIIAAAKENLWDKVKRNQFREDLFYRLNIININLPPLRERHLDIPLLISFFINRFSKLHNKDIKGIRPSAIIEMFHYPWEGNVRELQNVIQEAVLMNSTGWIEKEDLNFIQKNIKNLGSMDTFKSAKQSLINDFEKSYLNNLLVLFNGNLSLAAKFAKKDRRALCRLLKKYKLDPAVYRNHPGDM
jgi:two-component system, NtrC family, response regulator GlrR